MDDLACGIVFDWLMLQESMNLAKVHELIDKVRDMLIYCSQLSIILPVF